MNKYWRIMNWIRNSYIIQYEYKYYVNDISSSFDSMSDSKIRSLFLNSPKDMLIVFNSILDPSRLFLYFRILVPFINIMICKSSFYSKLKPCLEGFIIIFNIIIPVSSFFLISPDFELSDLFFFFFCEFFFKFEFLLRNSNLGLFSRLSKLQNQRIEELRWL